MTTATYGALTHKNIKYSAPTRKNIKYRHKLSVIKRCKSELFYKGQDDPLQS